MIVFVVFGFDKEVTLKDFLGVFATRKKAQDFIDNHFADFGDKVVPIYRNYLIQEVAML